MCQPKLAFVVKLVERKRLMWCLSKNAIVCTPTSDLSPRDLRALFPQAPPHTSAKEGSIVIFISQMKKLRYRTVQ